MLALILAVAAAGCLIASALLLRAFGPRYRVGRLLAATPLVSIEEAAAFAADRPTYVRVNGRISSAEEFPDEHNRPLVFRRKRIQVAAQKGAWSTVVDEREAVSFGVESRSAFIAVDEAALSDGLVVIPREADGIASDLPPDLAEALPDGHSLTMPTRLRIEQLSAVEHATVCGQPVTRDGMVMMTAGLGRPLIVTPLEQPAAMRILARDQRTRTMVVFALLVVGLGLAAGALVAFVLGA